MECQFEEHTHDIGHNQSLLWALNVSSRSGQCTERTLPTIRKAYRTLQGGISLLHTTPTECLGYLYNRLNDDYRPLHSLCRFIIELTGPDLGIGKNPMLPFLVEMPHLYELFVAEWLGSHLPREISLKTQYRSPIGEKRHFTIDMLLVDTESGAPLAVIDTKYKADAELPESDIHQVVAYAEAVGCRDAFLVSPAIKVEDTVHLIGRKKIRRLSFPLGGDLDKAGDGFQANLLTALGH